VLDDFTERRPYNAVSDFVDVNVARGLGAKIAFIDPDRSLTYGELQARSVRFAHALHALGLKHENRVALLMHDTVDYPVAFWGIVRAGCVAIPLNTFLNAAQYAYMLSDSRASALTLVASLVPIVAPVLDALPQRPLVIVVADNKTGHDGKALAFEDLTAKGDTAPLPQTRCRMRWLSGSIRRARPAIRRASSTFTPTSWRPPNCSGKAYSASARMTWCIRRPSCSSPTALATP
jgi:acyl-CoA synthetase (AMP-forming)/AMP-acid ligase II